MTFQPKNIAPPKKVIDPLIDATEDVRHSDAVPGDAPETCADEGAPSVLSEPVTGDTADTEPLPVTGSEDSASSASAETASEVPVTAPVSEFCNDAEFWGADCPEFDALMEQDATLMNGEMWGAKNRHNTQDGNWKQTTMPWRDWILGQDKTANTPAWGFSRHPVGKQKEGACIVLGSSIGKARTANAMEYMHAIGLDIDTGASLNKVLTRIEELGIAALAYTSFNHGKSGLQLKRDDVLRKLDIMSDPTVAEVRQYLREFDKNRYEDAFIAQVEIVNPKKQVKSGLVVELSSPLLEKYRLVFPLAEPVKIVDLAESHADALAIWEDKVTGLAVNLLNVSLDVSCTDPSRLFFTARHDKDADDYYAAIVRGRPLTFGEIEPYKKSLYTSKRRKLNPFEEASGVASDGDKPPMAYTPSGKSLNEWHNKAKTRFLLADVLDTYCPDRIRNVGGEAQGHVHVECPYEAEHSNEGGTGTMAVNALDSKNEYWTWFCHHDACQGRHKLQHLEEALRQGWFEESVLFDDEFILPAEDGEEDDLCQSERVTTREERAIDRSLSVRDELLESSDDFDKDTTEEEVRAVIRLALKQGADTVARAKLKEEIVAKTVITARPYEKLWKAEEEAFNKKRKQKSKAKTQEDGPEIPACDVLDDFPTQLEYAKERIRETNAARPWLFQYGGAYAMADAAKHCVSLLEDRDDLHEVLTKVTRWAKTDSEGSSRLVAPPEGVPRTLYKDREFAGSLPELLAVVSNPFFDRDGNLVDEDGYHAGAKVYLSKGDLVLSGVSRDPTPAEVTKAKRLLVEEVLADFPLAGMSRADIVGTLDGKNSEKAHAVTHCVAMTLLPFCRDMIAGPTPGHVFTKPDVGTGASLIVEMLTTIACGEPAPAMYLPERRDEIGKTVTSVLAAGSPFAFFDNVGKSIASPELAMAMTGTKYQARLLGRTQLVAVPVRCGWVFTGNNFSATPEILRRLIFILLDAGVPVPAKRVPVGGKWRHRNLRQWVENNRPELVWACLIIIQNWVAKGMQRSEKTLASYEDWAATMGGILEAASFKGFLEGQDAERQKAADVRNTGASRIVSIMAEYPSGTWFRPGGEALFGVEKTVSVKKLLNGEEREGKELGFKDQLAPIEIDGWGWNTNDERYNSSNGISAGMKLLARKPHEADGEVITFDEKEDKKNSGWVYRMNKKPLEKAPEAEEPPEEQAEAQAA